MAGEVTLGAVRLFVLMLAAAILVALAVRRTAIPYTVALIVIGLAVAVVGPDLEFAVTPELLLAVLLPGLIFEAAFNTHVEDLAPSFIGVLLLAIPGVVIVAALVAVTLNLATGLPIELAFITGAIVAATDPAAVIATFKRLRAPRKLATIVESESILNDGTAIVLFALALEVVAGGGSIEGSVLAFVVTVAVSTAIGLGGGFLAGWLVRLLDDHVLEIGVSVVLAYGTYLLAQGLGLSGIIATMVAAMTFGTMLRGLEGERLTGQAIDTVWEFLAFLLTAFVFLLVGTIITLDEMAAAVGPILWTLLAILVGRAFIVYGLVGLPDRLVARWRRTPALPTSWLHVMFWSGLRGGVAVALALSLPADLPQRQLIQNITFGIVLVTLIGQGVTADLVVRRSGATADRPQVPVGATPDRPQVPDAT